MFYSFIMKLVIVRIYFAILLIVPIVLLIGASLEASWRPESSATYVKLAFISLGAIFYWVNYLRMSQGKSYITHTVILACCIQSLGNILAGLIF